MKRFWMVLLCSFLAFSCLSTPALANGWGVTGDLLDAVSATSYWNDYSRLSKQVGSLAVMHTSRHNVLLVANGSKASALRAYTKAVYQPKDKRTAPTLSKTSDGFALAYGSKEKYTFMKVGEQYLLKEAVIGAFEVTAHIERDGEIRYIPYYEVTDGKQSAVYSAQINLTNFNISLFPHTIAQVRQLNLMSAALDSGRDCLGYFESDERGMLVQGSGEGTAPVYSAPFGKSAYRAGNGKAAVGLNGEFWLLQCLTNADGERYAAIRYFINPYTQRIGYVQGSAVQGVSSADWAHPTDFLAVDVRATEKTYLTDDPDGSQSALFTFPKDTTFACLGLYQQDYAYVTAEVKGTKFVDGGAILYGFVPLKALTLLNEDVDRETVSQLLGTWTFYAGGNMAEDELTFTSDGRYVGRYLDFETGDVTLTTHGTWSVKRYSIMQNAYWNDPPYELYLLNDNGSVTVRGLTFKNGEFSLTNWEGGGGYKRK